MKAYLDLIKLLFSLRYITFCTSLYLSFYSSPSWAHGEDRPGPRGGFVEMPGSYHSELVWGKTDIRVYLIDMEYRHPQVENSNVELTYKNAKITEKLKCRPRQDHFSCALSPKVRKTQGQLELQSTRLGQIGNRVVYSLPLQHKSH